MGPSYLHCNVIMRFSISLSRNAFGAGGEELRASPPAPIRSTPTLQDFMSEPTQDYSQDARLIFFRLDSLEEQMRVKDGEIAIRKHKEEEQQKELNVAYQKIRALSGVKSQQSTKLWILGGTVGGLSTLAFMLVEHLLKR